MKVHEVSSSRYLTYHLAIFPQISLPWRWCTIRYHAPRENLERKPTQISSAIHASTVFFFSPCTYYNFSYKTLNIWSMATNVRPSGCILCMKMDLQLSVFRVLLHIFLMRYVVSSILQNIGRGRYETRIKTHNMNVLEKGTIFFFLILVWQWISIYTREYQFIQGFYGGNNNDLCNHAF